MRKLIKITETHYVICEDIPIGVGEWYMCHYRGYGFNPRVMTEEGRFDTCKGCVKITHSTEPIGHGSIFKEMGVSLIPLQVVTNVLGLPDIYLSYVKVDGTSSENGYEFWLFKKGYLQALEDNKEKVYTRDDMAKLMAQLVKTVTEGTLRKWELRHFKAIIEEQCTPISEWDVYFDEYDNLKLV